MLCLAWRCLCYSGQVSPPLCGALATRRLATRYSAFAWLCSAVLCHLYASPRLAVPLQCLCQSAPSAAQLRPCFALLFLAVPLRLKASLPDAFALPSVALLCLCCALHLCASHRHCHSLPLRARRCISSATPLPTSPCLCNAVPILATPSLIRSVRRNAFAAPFQSRLRYATASSSNMNRPRPPLRHWPMPFFSP